MYIYEMSWTKKRIFSIHESYERFKLHQTLRAPNSPSKFLAF